MILKSIIAALHLLQPSLAEETTKYYAPLVLESSNNTGLDWKTIVAIGMQESSWIPRTRPDIGLFQISIDTALYHQLSIDRLLLDDLHYEFKAFSKIMKSKMKVCKKYEEYSWSCYHSKTPSLRRKYINKVSKYINKLENL